jgi:hypothetical protein
MSVALAGWNALDAREQDADGPEEELDHVLGPIEPRQHLGAWIETVLEVGTRLGKRQPIEPDGVDDGALGEARPVSRKQNRQSFGHRRLVAKLASAHQWGSPAPSGGIAVRAAKLPSRSERTRRPATSRWLRQHRRDLRERFVEPQSS